MNSKPEMQIGFSADKQGRPVAYRWSVVAGGRWFRIGYDEAKVLVATGQAREVRYVRSAA